MNPKDEHLIIQLFFDRIERELGYAPDLDKYFDFIDMLVREKLSDNLEARKEQIYTFARFLFCERERDEPRFRQIFDFIFEYERKLLDGLISQLPDPTKTIILGGEDINGNGEQGSGNAVDEEGFFEEAKGQPIPKPWEAEVPDRYLNFNTGITTNGGTAEEVGYEHDYVYSNDYHIISFREMIQSWRYFRLQQPLGQSDEPDIPEMIEQIAREGIFTEMKYQRAFINREDSMLILADRRGSMTPFHGLVDSLVRTATKEGGHHKAQVYYFQNYPLDYVYKNPFLTQPKRLDAVLSKVSMEHTYVLIVSDAGAAKGNLNMGRVKATGFIPTDDDEYELDQNSFLGKLLRMCKDVVWLNPMPRNRWQGTSAAVIADRPEVKMYSLHDSNRLGFTFAIKDLLYEG